MQKTIEALLESSFVKSINGETVLAFNGVMSQESVVGLGDVLRSELHHHHPLSIVNKVFAIFIELAQNVLHYSFDRADSNGKSIGKGSVFVFLTPKGYDLVTVNIISEKQKGFLEKKCESINLLTPDELKNKYLIRRKKVAEGDSKGAGLGFIDMVRRSGQPIKYAFEPIDNQQYHFFLSSNVSIE